jgi:U4/U6 small nuclear ribonucleoprotein PRP3
MGESAAEKMAALKARVAKAIGSSKAKGGLNVGLHPALQDLDQWKPPNRAADAKPATYRAQHESARPSDGTGSEARSRPQSNPYFEDSLASQTVGGKKRQARPLSFNQKGKYIQQGNALRRQAALEAMKKRIAEQTKRARIDDGLDTDKKFVVGRLLSRHTSPQGKPTNHQQQKRLHP